MNQLKIALVAAIAILAGIASRQPAAANTPVPCSGDDSACQLLVVEQRGTDPNSGAYPPAIHQSAAIYAAIDDADVVDPSSSDSCDSATYTSPRTTLEKSTAIFASLSHLDRR